MTKYDLRSIFNGAIGGLVAGILGAAALEVTGEAQTIYFGTLAFVGSGLGALGGSIVDSVDINSNRNKIIGAISGAVASLALYSFALSNHYRNLENTCAIPVETEQRYPLVNKLETSLSS